MAQKLIQTQTQQQTQQLRLTQQQLLNVKLLEMPINKLEDNVKAEMDDNPALEKDYDADEGNEGFDTDDGGGENDTEGETEEERDERSEREDALDQALSDMGSDDDMPEVYHYNNNDNADYEEMVYGDTTSFYDKLKEQLDMEPSHRRSTT